MNILLTNISAFPREVSDFEYEVRINGCEVDCVRARHTNESILKVLSHMTKVKNGGGIGKIVALTSKLVLNKKDSRFENLTAYEYVEKVCENSFASMPEIVSIDIETAEGRERSLCEIINDICSYISDEDVVYIDAAGGKRTITNVIQLLTKLLEYKGVQNPLTLYSDIQNNPKFITDTKGFEQLAVLADAFNEFMTTGKSGLLRRCVRLAGSSEEYRVLVDAMCDFSDKINLGKVDGLEETLLRLKTAIEQCKKRESFITIESVIIKQFLPVIEHKFIGDTKKNHIDYIKLVQWCIENDLLQQALTIFTEKVPISIFARGIVKYKGNEQRARKEHETVSKLNPLISADWETAVLYSEIMSVKMTNDDKVKIESFIECLKNSKSSSDEHINDVLCLVRNFKFNEAGKGRVEELLKTFCEKKSITEKKSLINSLCNNYKISGQLLGLVSDLKFENKMTVKFAAIEALQMDKIVEQGDFKFSRHIVDVLYGYLYVKSVRNTVNHASSEEILNDRQKEILSQKGYDFNSYDFQVVKKNISKALNVIVEADEC